VVGGHDRETQGTTITARVTTKDCYDYENNVHICRKECGITGSPKSLTKTIVVPVLNIPEPPTDAKLSMDPSSPAVENAALAREDGSTVSPVLHNGGRLNELNNNAPRPAQWSVAKKLRVGTLAAIGDPDGAQDAAGESGKNINYEYKCLSGANNWVNIHTNANERCGGPNDKTFYIDGNSIYLAGASRKDLDYEKATDAKSAKYTEKASDFYDLRKKAHPYGDNDWNGPYYRLSVKIFEPSGVVQQQETKLRIYLNNVNEIPSGVEFFPAAQEWVTIDTDGVKSDILQSAGSLLETTENGARVGYFIVKDPDFSDMDVHPCHYQAQMQVELENFGDFPWFAIRWSEDGETRRTGQPWGGELFAKDEETEGTKPVGYQPRECSYEVEDQDGNEITVKKGRWELWTTMIPTDYEEPPGPVYSMVVIAHDQAGLPRSDPQVSKAFTIVAQDKPEMPTLAAFAHYKINEDAMTGSPVGDITKALSEANPKTLQFRLQQGHKRHDGLEAFTIDACAGMVNYKMGVQFSLQHQYSIEIAVALRQSPPPTIVTVNGVSTIQNFGQTSMFIHVEVLDGETEPAFNPLVQRLYGRLKESSVCAADGGRIPGCACDSHDQCMKRCSCNTPSCEGTCLIPSIPIGAFDPDGPHDLVLSVSDSGNRNMDNKLTFEPARYVGVNPIDMPTFGIDSRDDLYIHPATNLGHIDESNALTSTTSSTFQSNQYQIDFVESGSQVSELTMITGVVVMAAPAIQVSKSYNYVKNDDDVVWGPTPDYESCQVQCDICNKEEDDSDEDTVECRCRSWTFDHRSEMCGFSRLVHTKEASLVSTTAFTSGSASGFYDASQGKNVPRGAVVEKFKVKYQKDDGSWAYVRKLDSVSEEGVETFGIDLEFNGNKWRNDERMYRYFDVAVWAKAVQIEVTAPILVERGLRVAVIKAPHLQLRCPTLYNCPKLDAELQGEFTLAVTAKDPVNPKLFAQGEMVILVDDVNEAPDVMVSQRSVYITEQGQMRIGANMVEFEHTVLSSDPENDDLIVAIQSQSPPGIFKIVRGCCSIHETCPLDAGVNSVGQAACKIAQQSNINVIWVKPKLRLVTYDPDNSNALDYDPPNNLKQVAITMIATDSNGLPGDPATQIIHVTDVNEAPYWKTGSINGWQIMGDGLNGKNKYLVIPDIAEGMTQGTSLGPDLSTFLGDPEQNWGNPIFTEVQRYNRDDTPFRLAGSRIAVESGFSTDYETSRIARIQVCGTSGAAVDTDSSVAGVQTKPCDPTLLSLDCDSGQTCVNHPHLGHAVAVSGWYGLEVSMNDNEGNADFEQRLDIFIQLVDSNEAPSLDFMTVDRLLAEDSQINAIASAADPDQTTVPLIDDEVYDGILHNDAVRQRPIYTLDPTSNPVDSDNVPLFRLVEHTFVNSAGTNIIGFNILLNRLGIDYETQTLFVLSVTVADDAVMPTHAVHTHGNHPSASSLYQMSIKIVDVNDPPSEPFYTAALTEFAKTDRIVVNRLLAADPDRGDTHTWEIEPADNYGETFFVEQDSLTDVWKIAVNNQGYACRVDFNGIQTPRDCSSATEAECTAKGKNNCVWVDRVAAENHQSTINGRNCDNPTHAPDNAFTMWLKGKPFKNPRDGSVVFQDRATLAPCSGGGVPGTYAPTKLKQAQCRAVVAAMVTGTTLDVDNSIVSGNVISFDNGSGQSTILRIQMDTPGGDFASSGEDFYIGGQQWNLASSKMVATSCSQMSLKNHEHFTLSGGPGNDGTFNLRLKVTDSGWMGGDPITIVGLLNITMIDANDIPKFQPETQPMCSVVRSIVEHTPSPLNDALPVPFTDLGEYRLIVVDEDVSTQFQTLKYSILSQNGNTMVNKFAIEQVLAPEINDNAYKGTLSVVGMLDFETEPVYKLVLEVRDDSQGGGSAVSCILTVKVTNANEPPCAVYSWKDQGSSVTPRYVPIQTACAYTTTDASTGVSDFDIPEMSANNVNIGTIKTTDPDKGDSLTFSLVSAANLNPNPFKIVDSATSSNMQASLMVSGTPELDFEVLKNYAIEVIVTDLGGLTASASVAISVTDVNDMPVATDAVFSLPENSASASLSTAILVGKVEASDQDHPDLIYSLDSRTVDSSNSFNCWTFTNPLDTTASYMPVPFVTTGSMAMTFKLKSSKPGIIQFKSSSSSSLIIYKITIGADITITNNEVDTKIGATIMSRDRSSQSIGGLISSSREFLTIVECDTSDDRDACAAGNRRSATYTPTTSAPVSVSQLYKQLEWAVSMQSFAFTNKELKGASVTQGTATGTLQAALSGSVTSFVIVATSGTVFDRSADILVGSTIIAQASLQSVTKTHLSSQGTLAAQMTGTTTELVIQVTSGAFHTSTNLVIGGASGTTVLPEDLTSVHNARSQTDASVAFSLSDDEASEYWVELDGTAGSSKISVGTGSSVGDISTLLVSKSIDAGASNVRYMGFATESGFKGEWTEICFRDQPNPSISTLFALESSSGKVTVKTGLDGSHHGDINFELRSNYGFLVQVEDTYNPAGTALAHVRIDIADVNEPPVSVLFVSV